MNERFITERPRKAQLYRFEDWMIQQGGGLPGLAAAFELAGIRDGECIRMAPDQQRAFFGKVIFGKRAIRYWQGRFSAFRSVCYGMDFDIEYF
jgi:hypothetical protein